MRSRRLVAAMVAVMIMGGFSWSSPGIAVAEPAVGLATIATGDWAPLFADDFSGTQLPSACTANDGPPSGVTASYYRPEEARVDEGMLRLSLHPHDYAGKPYTSGGVGCPGLVARYGRYQYRARVAPVAGIDSFVALLAEDGTTTDITMVEIFSEADGSNGAAAAQVSNAYDGGSIRKDVGDLTLDGFHEYQIDWTPSGLRVLIDEEEVFFDSNASGKYRWPEFALSTGSGESGVPNPDDLPTEFLIDWLRVFSYEPVDTSSLSSETSDGTGSRNASASSRTTRGTSTPILLAGVVTGLAVCAVAMVSALAFGIPRRLRRGRSAHRF